MSLASARSRLIRFPTPGAQSDDLALQVRDALAHLHDLPELQTHPLAALAGGSAPVGETRGRALRRALVEALAALRDGAPRRRAAEGTTGELLRLRYEEGLAVDEVARRLAISRAEYYRRHDRGLAAVVALLRQAWGNAPTAPAPVARVAVVPYQPTEPEAQPTSPAPARLPRALTCFVGRERELADVSAALMDGAPLVTLAGAGGCGKTRLAYEVARHIADRYPEGLWVVELHDLADPQTAPVRVAAALGLADKPGLAPTQQLLGHLRDRRALLVLDNCEHLLNAVASLVDALLRGCPSLQVLATSREPLAADGETVWRIPSLSVPPEDAVAPDEVLRSEAVRLFVDRARAAQPGFVLTEENGPAVADVCRRLDGIPLAIELAAARVRALSPREIAARLDDRFALLARNGVAMPRHRTLRASVDWSHDLLSGPERRLFARLAVFPAGWDLAAAEAVAGGAPAALDALSGLVDRSLVLAEPHGHDTRYRMLETLRAYARERLVEAGDEEATRARHAEHFLALAEHGAPRLRGPEQRAWVARLEREQPNTRAALDWLIARREAALALRLVGALGWFWHQRGHWRDGYALTTRVLALPGAEAEPAWPRALCAAGLLATDLGKHEEALHWLNDALARFGARGDRVGEAEAFNALGLVATERDDDSLAERYFERARQISTALGDRWGVGRALINLGELAQSRRDWPAARDALGRAVEELRAVGAPAAVGLVLGDLARVAHAEGARDEARRFYRESLSTHREFGIRYRMLDCLRGLASLEAEDGAVGEAVELLGEALRTAREMGQDDAAREIADEIDALAARPRG